MNEGQFNDCMLRMQQGDKSALHQVYEAYIGYIYSIILQVVQNRENAEDVTSEFFIRLWNIADRYEPGNGHRAWLACIARNMAVDLLRKHKKEILTDEFEGEMTQACPEEEVIADISLQEALAKLSEKEREIVNFKIIGELTFQEIADILKIPLGTITWRYQNAMKKLRRCGYE